MQPRLYLSREQIPGALVTTLFALFVVMLPRYTDTAKTWFVLLILGVAIYLARNWRQLRQTSRLERVFFAVLVGNFAWIAFCYYANGEPGRGSSFLWGRHFYLLFLIPLFYLFMRFEISDRTVVLILFCSAAVSLTDISVDLLRGIDHRLQGMNPNAFRPIQLCLSGIPFFYFLKLPRSALRWIALGGAAIGVSTVFLSLSRTTLITAMVLSVFIGFYLSRSLPAWKRGAIVAGILVLFVSSYSIPVINKRIDDVTANVSTYFASDDHRGRSRLGSFGKRMELWKTGWKIFLENPVTWVGVGGFKVMAKANFRRYEVNRYVQRKKYAHNQYIAALATRGIPGLVLFLLVLSLPLYIALSHRAADWQAETARLALMFICLVYLIGCLGEDHFEGKSATMFVAVFVALLLARLGPGESGQARASPA
ncbi:MAG: O-antigen ligase family protein [Gammaproteobacteria bacterium]|nr:O-antigen ligase family protein [Gammaproteobacteria bacterium]